LFWTKKSTGILETGKTEWTYWYNSFDALHFQYIAEHGYTHEKSHAFFPGLPILLDVYGKIAAYNGVNEVLACVALQICIGAINCVMLYTLTRQMLICDFFALESKQNDKAEQIAFGAALLYCFS